MLKFVVLSSVLFVYLLSIGTYLCGLRLSIRTGARQLFVGVAQLCTGGVPAVVFFRWHSGVQKEACEAFAIGACRCVVLGLFGLALL